MTLKKRTPGTGDHKCKGPEAGVLGNVKGQLSSVRPVQREQAEDVRVGVGRGGGKGWVDYTRPGRAL